jgi:RNA polymerase sigma-70 factor (ECF subfamily)
MVAVRLARVDRQDWFDGLYSATYRAVVGCVYFVVLDRDIAAEITHDAFLRLWEHYGRLPAGSNEKAWLIRVATNLAISHRRSQGAEWRRHVDDLEPIDPGMQALNNLDLVRVRRALLTLERRDRAVISLRFDQGLGFAEIGAIVGKPENTVKTRFHRSLETLRRQLGDAAPLQLDSPTKEGSNG